MSHYSGAPRRAYVMVHHAGYPNAHQDTTSVLCNPQGVAYDWQIRWDGAILTCSVWNNTVGQHARGCNCEAIGIVLMGCFGGCTSGNVSTGTRAPARTQRRPCAAARISPRRAPRTTTGTRLAWPFATASEQGAGTGTYSVSVVDPLPGARCDRPLRRHRDARSLARRAARVRCIAASACRRPSRHGFRGGRPECRRRTAVRTDHRRASW